MSTPSPIRTKLRYNAKQKYLFIDTETEGLNLALHRPWQCSWLLATGNKIDSISNRFIWWDDLKVSDDAARITGFNYNAYKEKAEKPSDVLADLMNHLSDPKTYIVGQNILGYDLYILNVWYQAVMGCNFDWGKVIHRVIDTKSIEMCLQNGSDFQDFDVLPIFMYRWINHRDKKIKTSQLSMLDRYGIKYDKEKLHDAQYDIEMLFQIFQKQLQAISL